MAVVKECNEICSEISTRQISYISDCDKSPFRITINKNLQ